MTLIRQKAITAAKAPPARSFAQEPPMAAANRMCRLLMIPQPISATVVPKVVTADTSPPTITIRFPILIISPAAGITAMTVINTFPSFCKKSKLIGNFFFAFCSPLSSLFFVSFATSLFSFTVFVLFV